MWKFWLSFIGIPIAILLWGRISYIRNENKQQEKGVLFSTRLIHIGGLSGIPTNMPVLFEIKDRIINIKAGSQIFIVKINDVTNCEIKNETQITAHPTVTRMLALGVFAFAFPKKKIDTTLYLILSYEVNGLKTDCVFKESSFSSNMYDIPNTISQIQVS